MTGIKINAVLGIPADEILTKQHNLWVGVSDSGWFLAPGHLEQIICWALEHTRQELLIWIPGRMYAVNTYHLDKISRARALREGYAIEDCFRARVETVFASRPSEERSHVQIAGYDDLLTPTMVRRRSILYRAFSEEGEFYSRVMEVVEDYLIARQRTVSKTRMEAVAMYQLQELPMFIAPVQTIDADTVYVAEIYPGLGKFDWLVRDLVEGRVFPDLTQKLQLTEQCGMVSVELEGKF
ncbi:MAG: tRNA-dependent cyclodipeptide synthase [Patescibacteria group bacterium]|jgi:tRNA-dependent cyclodipeptide synthase